VRAQAPIDFAATASRFVVEELSHAELAARILEELGGRETRMFASESPYPAPSPRLRPLMQAAYYMMRVFCTGEAFSLPMVHAAAQRAAPRLIRAAMQRIAKDEAAHGSFGWIFFDWAQDRFDARDRKQLKEWARAGVAAIATVTDGPEADDS